MQQKRFQAQSIGSTYAYDIPDMFRQMTERLWREHAKARPSIDIRMPEKVLLQCVELVVNGDTLDEIQRLPGENDVIKHYPYSFVSVKIPFSFFIILF